MKDSFLKKIKILMIGVLAVSGLLVLERAAQAQACEDCAPTCFDDCFAKNANNPDLLCCDKPCDARTYCDMACECGNGLIGSVCGVKEECDDGNTEPGDGCDGACKSEVGGECDLPDSQPTTPVWYNGVPTTDLVLLKKIVERDHGIKPTDPVYQVAVRGASYWDADKEPPPQRLRNLRADVMTRKRLAENLREIAFYAEIGFPPDFSTAIPMELNIGCIWPISACFDWNEDGDNGAAGSTERAEECAKGCKENARAIWSSSAQLCPSDIGCCVDTVAPISNFTKCKEPSSVDNLLGNLLY